MNDIDEKKPPDGEEKPPVEEANPYKEAILNLDKTHVSREAYDKVVKERQELIDSITAGTAAQKKKKPPRDVKTLAIEGWLESGQDLSAGPYLLLNLIC